MARRQYGICTPIECDYDYHIEDGQCLPDEKQCELAHGSGHQECEIATCMYQGQKYILTADNECMSVCENLSDETGEMWWNNATKTCKRVCAPGYKQWN